MQGMKAQRLIHATRVKRALEHVAESKKPRGNGKCMRAGKAVDHMEVENAHKAQAPPTCT